MKLQRREIPRNELSHDERAYLLDGYGPGFSQREADGNWGERDEASAFDAWLRHRTELLSEAGEHGLIPFAARHFEGMAGSVSPYEHLRLKADR